MVDYATLPGGIYMGSDGDEVVDADTLFSPGVFDNLILTFGGNDYVTGRNGNDTILLGEGNDTALGGQKDDVLLGEAGDDMLVGGQGKDTLVGGSGNDLLDAGDGHDLVDGGDGDDAIYGGDGHDLLYGGAGNDLIAGGEGHDTIIGGAGDDTLIADAGKDVFVFESGFGKDVVLGFQKGQDKLEIEAGINGLAITKASDVVAYIGGSAASPTITLGSDTIQLVGVSKDDLIAHINNYVKIV